MDIKLFVCCHQPSNVPDHPLLVPVQVGAKLAENHFEGFCHDDTGENISEKNRSYCELTAQYWAWKNVDADYYGFFHYRRYLYPRISAKNPYRIEGEVNPKVLGRLNFNELSKLIPKYDLIAPVGENMHISVREHYASAEYHHRKDLELMEEIIHERYPEMIAAMERYLAGTICYFGNIYIMKRGLFHSYCEWLFSVLEEFDCRVNVSNYGVQELRVDGYLAERLFGIYHTFCKDSLRTIELPRVHFNDGNSGTMKRVINALLPAGSKRRAIVKQIAKGAVRNS